MRMVRVAPREVSKLAAVLMRCAGFGGPAYHPESERAYLDYQIMLLNDTMGLLQDCQMQQ